MKIDSNNPTNNFAISSKEGCDHEQVFDLNIKTVSTEEKIQLGATLSRWICPVTPFPISLQFCL